MLVSLIVSNVTDQQRVRCANVLRKDKEEKQIWSLAELCFKFNLEKKLEL